MRDEAQTVQNVFDEIMKCYHAHYIDISQQYVDKIDAILEKMFNDPHTIWVNEHVGVPGIQHKKHLMQPIFEIYNTRDNSHRFVFHSCDQYDYKTYADELIECFILSPTTLELPQSFQEHPNIKDIETKFTSEKKQFIIRFKSLLERKDRCNLTENIVVTKKFPNYELKMIDQRKDLFVEEMYKRMQSFTQKSKFGEYIELKYKQNMHVLGGPKRELHFQFYKFTQQQELKLI